MRKITALASILFTGLALLAVGACARSPTAEPIAGTDPSLIRSENLTSLVPAARLDLGGGVVWSSDGRMLAVGGHSGVAIFAYEPGAVARIHNLPTDTDIQGLAFSPDGQILATGRTDGVVRLWDVASGELIHSLTGHSGAISGLSFHPDGSILASGSYVQETVLLWDPVAGSLIGEIPLSGGPGALAFSPDGRWIGVAAVSISPTIELHTLDGGGLPPVSFDEQYSVPFSLAFSPDGQLVAAAGDHLAEGAGENRGIVRLWRIVETGLEPLTAFETEALMPDETAVSSIAFSPDGDLFAVASRNNRLELRSALDGQLLHWLDTFANGEQSVSFSPDRRILALGRYDAADTILWEIGDQYASSPRTLSLQSPYRMGSDVWQVEDRLIELGYLELGLDDGVFDEGAENAVRSFQIANGLAQSGAVEPETRDRLIGERAVAAAIPTSPAGGSTTPTAPPPEIPSATPRIAPTSARTTTPTAPPAAVRTTRPTQPEIFEVPSIWEFFGLSSGLDLEAPGSREFTIDVDPETRLIWPFYWCASDGETLAENLPPLTVVFEIDGVPVSLDHILEYEAATQYWDCHYWATMIIGWEAGTTSSLTIRYVFSRSVYDGVRAYPAGEYSYTLKATVRGEDG